MITVKMKIGKGETVIFDGESVTTGKWAALAPYVRLSSKTHQTLIDAGKRFQDYGDGNGPEFDRDSYPDFNALIPAKSAKRHDLEITKLGMTCEVRNYRPGWVRFIRAGGIVVAVDERFLPLIEGGAVAHLYPDERMIVVREYRDYTADEGADGDVLALVMLFTKRNISPLGEDGIDHVDTIKAIL